MGVHREQAQSIGGMGIVFSEKRGGINGFCKNSIVAERVGSGNLGSHNSGKYFGTDEGLGQKFGNLLSMREKFFADLFKLSGD